MAYFLAPREWRLRLESEVDEEAIRALQSETGLSRVTLQVCWMRGLRSPLAIREFLNPRFETLTSPMKLRDMDRAVERLVRARQMGEKVRIYGDYDVDGTTGAALLCWTFGEYGIEADARQPDRFKDGYGLNVGAVEAASQEGAKVLVTVDCGITSFAAAKRARELGLDLVVVDHHQLDPTLGLPEAYAVVNPQRQDCESGLKQLCGCGLAFYLSMALRARGRLEGWFAPGSEPNLKQHLDLVVMATAADMVPLTGDNHILVRQGLEVLKRSSKPGVRALLQAAGLSLDGISPGHLGFVIGPRINASGRMHSACLALEMLTTRVETRAVELASELERLNRERSDLQNQIWDEVRSRVEKGMGEGRFQHGIVVADPGWHEGVVGIVASRVTETFRKPAAVIALREDFGKGSVRSYGGKDILSALRASASHLLGFGGHKHAAGLSVALDQVDALADAFDHALAGIQEDATTLPLLFEGRCELSDLDIATLQELERLGPFGPGNPEPVFVVRGSVQNYRILKGRHLKFQIGNAALKNRMDAIWFHAAEHDEISSGNLFGQDAEWAGVPEINRFRGNMTPTFRVRDRKPLS